jgi:hypothetical protein
MYILAEYFPLHNFFTFPFSIEKFSFNTGKILTDLHSISLFAARHESYD